MNRSGVVGLIGRLLVPACAAAMVLVAATTLGGVFAGTGWELPLLGSALLGIMTGAVLLASRAEARWLVFGTVVAVAAAEVATSVRVAGLGSLAPATLRDQVLLSLPLGWSRMLTVGAPARSTLDLLALPVLLCVLAGVLAVVASRGSTQLLPILPSLLLYAVGLLLTASVRGTRLLPAVTLLVLALAVAFVRAEVPPSVAAAPATAHARDAAAVLAPDGAVRTVTLSRSAVGLPFLAMVVIVAGVVGSAAPLASSAQRYDPRSGRHDLTDDRSVLSPLIGLKRELGTRPAADLFTVTLHSGPRPTRLRTGYLSAYDGVLWSDADRFVRPPAQVDARVAASGTSSMSVAVSGLPGPYLPVAGAVAQVEGDGLQLGATHGNLITDADSLEGLHYDVVSAVPVAESDPGLRGQPAGGPEWREGDVSLPDDLPAVVTTLADKVVAGSPTPYARAQAIERLVRTAAGYSVAVPPGESLATVAQLLSREPPYRAGFAEQRASAFAVLARAVGLPTRVAVGYLVKPASWRASSATVTTADAHAWPEVLFAGAGWVAFEPTDVSAPPDLVVTPTQTQTETTIDPGRGDGGGPGVVVDPSLADADSASAQVLKWLGVVAAAATALVIAGVALVVSTKYVRRRRRRSAPSAWLRVTGAWAEALDRLDEHGLRVPASDTPMEVGDRVVAWRGDEAAGPVRALAPLVASALYAAGDPSEVEVEQAWRCEGDLRSSLDAGSSLLTRLPRRASPRTLVRGERVGRVLERGLTRVTRRVSERVGSHVGKRGGRGGQGAG